MKLKKIFSAGNAVLGLLLALVPFCLAPVCSSLSAGGGHMKCWYSAVFITAVGAMLCAASLVSLLCGSRGVFTVLLLGTAAAAAVWLAPDGVIPVNGCGWCMAPAHACRALTRPLVLKAAAVLALLDLSGLTLLFIKGGSR